MSDLDPNKIFQVRMDGPNVNLKFLQLVQQDKDENHTIHAFIPYIMYSNQERNKLTGIWKWFSKQPIKSFMTLQRGEMITLLSLVSTNFFHHLVQQGWWFFFKSYLFVYSTKMGEITFYYLCTTSFNLGSLIFWFFQPGI